MDPVRPAPAVSLPGDGNPGLPGLTLWAVATTYVKLFFFPALLVRVVSLPMRDGT